MGLHSDGGERARRRGRIGFATSSSRIRADRQRNTIPVSGHRLEHLTMLGIASCRASCRQSSAFPHSPHQSGAFWTLPERLFEQELPSELFCTLVIAVHHPI